jgi:hypothetical protein
VETTAKATRAKTVVETVSEEFTEEVTVTKTTAKKAAAGDAKAAWGALFTGGAKKPKAPVNADGERVWPRPKRAEVTADLQEKIDAFAKFDGVASASVAGAWKLVAWNVNGLRALLKKEDSVHLRAYVAQEDPDVLCLSETKIDSAELQKVLKCLLWQLVFLSDDEIYVNSSRICCRSMSTSTGRVPSRRATPARPCSAKPSR